MKEGAERKGEKRGQGAAESGTHSYQERGRASRATPRRKKRKEKPRKPGKRRKEGKQISAQLRTNWMKFTVATTAAPTTVIATNSLIREIRP